MSQLNNGANTGLTISSTACRGLLVQPPIVAGPLRCLCAINIETRPSNHSRGRSCAALFLRFVPKSCLPRLAGRHWRWLIGARFNEVQKLQCHLRHCRQSTSRVLCLWLLCPRRCRARSVQRSGQLVFPRPTPIFDF
ncbi:hypothetical protein CORC01_05069 [Colletotrichum orchidophilum]|uniref:Uncharacterized protein n=1 Tax=Colletotrichum orchidophilum TaxID=1209926 RepID=A0A1G4BE85_9PEZI|nr:uncharacterized protein CORC01_05069 [Colletotrichum orchidophilum]OHE99711.1 hypothetical protein CORC01_05069 [Colletotrichum orchidophilum]